jgi:hypothetical protein
MIDSLKDVGKSDRIRASLQKHEVKYLAKKFRVSGQAAAVSPSGESSEIKEAASLGVEI